MVKVSFGSVPNVAGGRGRPARDLSGVVERLKVVGRVRGGEFGAVAFCVPVVKGGGVDEAAGFVAALEDEGVPVFRVAQAAPILAAVGSVLPGGLWVEPLARAFHVEVDVDGVEVDVEGSGVGFVPVVFNGLPVRVVLCRRLKASGVSRTVKGSVLVGGVLPEGWVDAV